LSREENGTLACRFIALYKAGLTARHIRIIRKGNGKMKTFIIVLAILVIVVFLFYFIQYIIQRKKEK